MADQLVFRSAGRGAPSQPGDVLRMILKRGMTLAAIGVPAGLAISFLITRFIATLLYGVTPFDAVTFCAMSLVLLAVAFVASVAPAYRAAQTDPMTTLRTQ
jgi:putative ABC transport system permease protein